MTREVISIALAVLGGLFLWLSGLAVGIRLASGRAPRNKDRDRGSAEHQVSALKQQLTEEAHKAKQAETGRLVAEGELSGAVVRISQLEGKLDKAKSIINELSNERAMLLQATPRPSAAPLSSDGRQPSSNPRPSKIPRPSTLSKPVRKP